MKELLPKPNDGSRAMPKLYKEGATSKSCFRLLSFFHELFFPFFSFGFVVSFLYVFKKKNCLEKNKAFLFY